ncbi:hypothetical protein ACOMHN_051957 [Nucella lapillus]
MYRKSLDTSPQAAPGGGEEEGVCAGGGRGREEFRTESIAALRARAQAHAARLLHLPTTHPPTPTHTHHPTLAPHPSPPDHEDSSSGSEEEMDGQDVNSE